MIDTRLERWAKRALFPGLDLHTRSRYRHLPRFFRGGPIDALDAGCGNGALAYAAYRLGNRVLGVTIDPAEAQRARDFFSARRADPSRLHFEVCNLYDIRQIGRRFDQIICSETLEHVGQDHLIVQYFHDILRENGVLHLCCPYAVRPIEYQKSEDGGHMRNGYNLETYRALLEPVGFEIVMRVGLGSPRLQWLDRYVRRLRDGAGDLVAVPLFLLSLPLQLFDPLNPTMPYSLYVQAVKRPTRGAQ